MKLDQVHCEHMQYSLSRKRGGVCVLFAEGRL